MPGRGQREVRGRRGRRWAALATVGIVVVAWTSTQAGATASAQDTAASAQDTAASERPIAAASAPPEPTVAVSVRGTSTLVGLLDAGSTVVEDGVVRTRDSVLQTVERSSDPRVSGEATITLDIDAYRGGEGTSFGGQVRYGRMRLENEDGAWEGDFTGRLSASGFLQTYWLAGEGAYAGWSYVVTAGGNGDVWFSDGLIYPGAVPAASALEGLPIEGPARDLPSA